MARGISGQRSFIFKSVLALSLSIPLALGSGASCVFAQGGNSQVIGLNNDGVKALQQNNYQLAIQKFEAALKIDPTYQLARSNLAIAHNNYGLQLRNNPKEALKQFHQALYLDRANTTTLQNVEGIIKIMGKNPRSFQDRVELGDQARLSADFVGAIIEYEAALKIKDDAKLRVKLGDVYRVRDETDQAINQYKIAASMGDSADIEVKLGQAYQAKKDIPNAIAAYGKAISFKSDDPDVQDALVAGWEEALKQNPLAPENHIGLGQAFQYRGDWGQAEEEYKQAIRFSPGHQNATAQKLLMALPQAKAASLINKHIDRGVDLQTKKLYDEAIQEYNMALQIDPKAIDPNLDIGTAYQAKGDFQNAIKYYKIVLSIDPSNQAAQEGLKTATEQYQDQQTTQNYQAGGDLFKQGQYDQAIQKFQAVLQNNPKDAATHFSLGACYQAKNDLEDAIGEYRTAVDLDGKKPEYQTALQNALEKKAAPIIDAAVAKHKAKDYAGAIDLYNQALAITPKNASLWYDIAAAEYSRQNYDASQQAYQKAYDMDNKGQVSDLYFIGTIQENAKQGAKALATYQKYLKEAPTGTYAAAAKERVGALTKNINDTQKIKSEEEIAQDSAADAAYTAAVQLQGQKQFDQAIAKYKEAIAIHPNNGDYHYSLGTCYQQKGDLDNAIAEYQKALSLDPKNKDALAALADAQEQKAAPIIDEAVKKQTGGDAAGAIPIYQQALQIVPNNARGWTNLGTAYQQTDQYDQARGAYQKAYELDKKNEVGDLYLMAALDENANQGTKALGEYQQYLKAAPTGNYAQAAKERVKALSANPNNVVKLQTQAEVKQEQAAGDAYNAGVKLQQEQKYDDAIAEYQKAATANPKEPAYPYAIGTAYQAKNDMDNAVIWYQKAVDLAPTNKDFKAMLEAAKGLQSGPVMNEAVAKHQAGDYQAAIDLYKKALAIAPNNAHGYTNMAGAYQSLGDFANARSSYQKAYDLDKKGEVDDLYFIGLIDENANQGVKAKDDYINYVKLAPRGTYAAQAQARIKALTANPNAVQKLTTAAEEKKSSEASDLYSAAIKLQQDNKLDEAIDSYKKAIAVSPDASYYYGMGTAYQAKNDIDSAIEAYKTALSKSPQETTYKQTLKAALQIKAAPLVESAIKKQTGSPADVPGAIADYEAALKIDDDASTHMNLGTAYQGSNNLPKALSNYLTAERLDAKTAADSFYYAGTVYEAMKDNAKAIAQYREYLRIAPSGANAAAVKARLKILAPGRR